ncbi:MAG: ABC transporter ATP-binding protein [Gemmatimonadaceae bacterium]
MIEYRAVTVNYAATAADAVHDVSFTAVRGAVTALVGPNGSGKSTLVRALLRRVPLTSGIIHVEGVALGNLERSEFARRVAVVTQREDTAFVRTVREYIELGRFPHRGRGSSGDAEAVRNAAERAGITSLLERPTDAVSGGEWQRVRVARALAQGGDAIVLDEPTAFLDVANEMQIFEMLSSLAASGVAVLLVSHQLNLVARFAAHIVLLHRGSVVAAGAPDVIMRGDLLESVYDWPLVITRDPAVGVPALVPLRRAH